MAIVVIPSLQRFVKACTDLRNQCQAYLSAAVASAADAAASVLVAAAHKIAAAASAGAAAASASQAGVYAAMAQAVTAVFESKALGLAGTTNGQFFSVIGGVNDTRYSTVYKNNAGVAQEFGALYSKAFLDTVFLADYARSGYLWSIGDGQTEPRTFFGLTDAEVLELYAETKFVGVVRMDGATLGGQAVAYDAGYSGLVSIADGAGRKLLDFDRDGTALLLPRPSVVDGASHTAYDRAAANGTRQVYAQNKTTGAVVQLSSSGNNFGPRFTSDGARVVWTTDRDFQTARDGLMHAPAGGGSEAPALPALDMIAAYGDSMTEGVGGGGGGAYYLQLASMLPRARMIGRGVSSQYSTDIAQRQGGQPINVTFTGNQIQASGAATVTVNNDPLRAATIKLPGTVGGVYGELTKSGGVYTFTRMTAGSVVNLGGAAAFTVENLRERGALNLIWSGRNNYSSLATVRADIAAMVASLTPLPGLRRFLVLSVCNATGEGTGTAAHTAITALNAALLTDHGNRFVDVRAALVAAFNPGLPDDVTANSEDRIPPSLLSDGLHLNAAGYLIVAQTVKARLDALGWTPDYVF